jgi:LCP family protein required for cell wall assembly
VSAKLSARAKRTLAAAGVAVLVLVMLVSVNAAGLVLRVGRFPIQETQSAAAGETWVIVGTDSRDHIPDGEDVYYDGGIPGGMGERADIILVARVEAGEMKALLSVPRDLVLPRTEAGGFERVSASLEEGEPALVHALCAGLGIPADHLVKVTLRGFVETVDALGGLKVDLPYSTRDQYSFLAPTGAGPQTLDGTAALALIRSRHPEYLIDGAWREATPEEGNAARASNAGIALGALRSSAKSALGNPVRLQRAAWAVASGFELDRGTSLWSLASLAQAAGAAPVTTLPGETTGTELALLPDESTLAATRAAGFSPGSCTEPGG